MPNSVPIRRRRWSSYLPAAIFLGAASYLFLRSHVYLPPRVLKLSGLPLRDLDDSPVPVSATLGKAVVLNFWAPWCGPCLTEMPWLQHLQQTHPDVAVIGIEDDPGQYEPAKSFAGKNGISYLLVRSDGAVRSRVGEVAALPTTLYISPDGRVIHTATGIVPESVMLHYLEDATASR